MDKTLQSIEWSSYRHAYGPAENIPEAIESLKSVDPAVRENALDHLSVTIYHQGDIYSATAPAVEALIRLAANEQTPARPDILGLVEAIAESAARLPDQFAEVIGPPSPIAGFAYSPDYSNEPVDELIARISTVADYEPGQFYKRELPCILELLKQLKQLPEYIVIDGYVYLGDNKKFGLGKHLYDALQERPVIIGVAKSRFKDTPAEVEVFRGGSKRALYVTAVGISESDAKSFVLRMHGEHRLPTILKRVDQLSKELV